MLVLTRKAGEAITIGDGIKIKILDVKEGKVRLGIDAPSESRILRDEVLERIQNEMESPQLGMMTVKNK